MIQRIIDIPIIIAALIMATSPYVFGYYSTTGATGTAAILGFLSFLFSVLEFYSHDAWKAVALVVVGGVIAASPWALGNYLFMPQKAATWITGAGITIAVMAVLELIVSVIVEKQQNSRMSPQS